MKQMPHEVVLSKNQLCEYTSINGTSRQLTAEPLSGDQPAWVQNWERLQKGGQFFSMFPWGLLLHHEEL